MAAMRMRRALPRKARQGKEFFFEKKNQKTFATWRTPPERSATAVKKFFGSFFQKRTASLPLNLCLSLLL
jgi:hypothetical protein